MARAPFEVCAMLAVLASAACHQLSPLADHPVMALSASSLSFEAALGGADPAAQTVTVRNSGAEVLAQPTVSIAYASGSGWLSATVSGSAAPYTVTVQPSLAGLAAGDWSATIDLASSGAAGSPLALEVTLRVGASAPPPPGLALSRSSLDFHARAGGADPAAQTITVGDSGAEPLAQPTVSISYASGEGWLSATLSGDAAPYTITVQPVSAGLAAGEYTATLSVSAEGLVSSPRPVAVALAVAPAPFSVGAPAELASMTLDDDCWLAEPEHAVFTTAGGTTWVATAEHHGCDTGVDPVVVYRKAGSGSWSAATPYSYDHSAHEPTGTWTRGVNGPISMAASSAGDPQVLVNQQKGDYWFPARGVYLRQSGGTWHVTEDVVSDEDLQSFQNAPSSSYAFSIVDDPATDTLHLLGCDSAPGTTSYHAVYSSAAVGSSNWRTLGAIYTASGAVDRASIVAPSQDVRGGAGVQVWADAPSCALRGRELSGGSWGANAITIPLGALDCSGDASARWGLCGARSETLLSSTGVASVLFTAAPCDARSLRLLEIATRREGSWSADARAIAWGTGVASWRAFDAASGGTYVVHTDANRKSLMLYEVATGEDLTMYRTENTIGFIDVERHDPKVIVWTESDSARRRLEVADLVPGT